MFTSIVIQPETNVRRRVSGIMWAILRVWVGVQFVQASLQKIGSPAWTGVHAGAAVRGFLTFAASPAMTGGPHPNVLSPYAWLSTHVLLSHAVQLSYLVTAGEFTVGIALIMGLGTRVAALGGVFLNCIYMLSGSAGLNVPMFAIGLSIVLVGAASGLLGMDGIVLPFVRRQIVVAHARSRHQARETVAAGI